MGTIPVTSQWRRSSWSRGGQRQQTRHIISYTRARIAFRRRLEAGLEGQRLVPICARLTALEQSEHQLAASVVRHRGARWAAAPRLLGDGRVPIRRQRRPSTTQAAERVVSDGPFQSAIRAPLSFWASSWAREQSCVAAAETCAAWRRAVK